MNKKHGIELTPGTIVKGKWQKNEYIIIKKLGEGTVGTVYLTKHQSTYAALKMSEQQSSLTIEANVLKNLAKVQGTRLGPYLIEMDDYETSTGTYSFYVMEYLKGKPLIPFIREKGQEWIGVIMLQLLDDLEKLHRTGWVLGDLKTENLLVVSDPIRIRWVDVGGTTKMGRAIKEYTEFFDRGYWGLGTRKADASYDLFALAMVIVNLAYPNRFAKTDNPRQLIYKKIDRAQILKPYETFLKRAVSGTYRTSLEMRQDILQKFQNQSMFPNRHSHIHTEPFYRTPIFIESGGIMALAIIFYLSSLLFP